MPVKNKQSTKYQVWDKVYYRAYGGGLYQGVVVDIKFASDGRPVYRINIPNFRDSGPTTIESWEHNIESPQMGLFAAKQPRFQVGDAVEYIGDTNDGIWVIIRAKYRPQKKMWIYWIRPREYDSSDKYMPEKGMSVWEHDLFPIQQSLNLKEKPKFEYLGIKQYRRIKCLS